MFDSIKLGKAQIIGAREEQQDAFGFSNQSDREFEEHGGVVAAVADGIGGHAHGGEASEVAVEEFLRDYLSKPKQTPIPDALYHALKSAHRAVSKLAKSKGEAQNCGTTLVAAVVHPGSDYLSWVSGGDSRLYLLRGKQLVQLTSDSNYAGQLVKKISQGTFDLEEVRPEAKLGALTCFLGMRTLEEVDRSIRPFKVQTGDWLVLCTDGVYNSLSVQEMIDCLQGDPQEACDKLMQLIAAKNLKNQDNATVAIMMLETKGEEIVEAEDMEVTAAKVSEQPAPDTSISSELPSSSKTSKRGARFWMLVSVLLAIFLAALFAFYFWI